jgi:hypothetical protein
VFEVLERQPATRLTLDEARPLIVNRLTRQRRTDSLRAWKARLLADARVEIRDATLIRVRPAELAEEGIVAGAGMRRRPAAGDAR